MAQLHMYLPEGLASEVRRRAAEKGQSVSAYLAALVRSQISDEWPKGFFDRVVGGWVGGPLERSEELEPERRDELDVSARYERVHSDSE